MDSIKKSLLQNKLLLLLLIIANSNLVSGQLSNNLPVNLPNILPPSPDAYSITKYGGLSIGLNTGTAQFNKDIYTIKSGSLTFPISINYSSNGVKVDEMATRVGINWNLNSGGIITRNVLGLPDDAPGVISTFIDRPVVWGTYGNSYNTGGDNYIFDPLVWDFYSYVHDQSEFKDYQPDEYSFNVNGYSGKFLRRKNGEFTQFSSSAIKIEKNSNGFILTVPTGDKYYFYLSEITRNPGSPENLQLAWIPSYVPTTWHLTKIVSASGIDEIIFNYTNIATPSAITYLNGISQTYNTSGQEWVVNTSKFGGLVNLPYTTDPYVIQACGLNGGLLTTVIKTENNPKAISSIVFNEGQIEFEYSNRQDVVGEKKLDKVSVKRHLDDKIIKQLGFEYTYSNYTSTDYDLYNLPTSNYTFLHPELRKRLFLTAISDISNNPNNAHKYTFEYEDINSLPPRLTFAQDRYGFFNGKQNKYFFPNDTWFDYYHNNRFFGGDRKYNFLFAKKGILKKINYPTGGFTKFEYEPNKTFGDYDYKNESTEVFAEIDTSTFNGQIVYSEPLEFDGARILQLLGKCTYATTPPDIGNESTGFTDFADQYYIKIEIINVASNSPVNTSILLAENDFYNGQLAYFNNHGLPAGTYKIKLTANRKSLKGKITLRVIKKVPDHSEFSGVAGVRVKSIVDYSDIHTETNKREFIYTNWDDNVSTGTGIRLDGGRNEQDVTMTIYGGMEYNNDIGQEYDCGFNTIHSNSILSNYTTNQNTVIYKKVIQISTGKDNNNNGGSEYEFYYVERELPRPVSYAWPQYRWEIWPVVPDDAPYINNDYFTGLLKCSKDFSFEELNGTRKILKETKKFYSVENANLIIDTFIVSKRIRSLSGAQWPYFTNHLIYKYWRYFGFLKLDQIVETLFTDDGNIVNTTTYESYSSSVFEPNIISSVSSNGDINRTIKNFAGDISGDPIINSMKSLNIVNTLIKENYYKNGNPNKRNRSTYLNIPGTHIFSPSEIYFGVKSNPEDLQLKFDKYDDRGNILQYTAKDGITTSLLWAYNKQYPVAKIVGAAHSQIEGLVNQNTLDHPSSDQSLRDSLNKIREHLLTSKAQVTTFTYSPLIGLTSQTDLNNRTTYYQYDDFNRLSIVKDNEGNIIKKYCYNYKGDISDCGFGTSPNWTVTNSMCESGTNGQGTGNAIVTEKDLNPNSTTFNTQRTSTKPDPTCVCIGEGKKIVNGICEMGIKQCLGFSIHTVPQTHVYNYKWSDGTYSIEYIGEGLCDFEIVLEP